MRDEEGKITKKKMKQRQWKIDRNKEKQEKKKEEKRKKSSKKSTVQKDYMMDISTDVGLYVHM